MSHPSTYSLFWLLCNIMTPTQPKITMTNRLRRFVLPCFIAAMSAVSAYAQQGQPRGVPKPVTVPISVRLRGGAPTEMRFVDFLLREDGDVQQEVSQLLERAS